MHTYIHTYIYIHTYVHTYIHTYGTYILIDEGKKQALVELAIHPFI